MNSSKTERGQSLVELSISLVFMLFLLAGAVEFGMAFFQFIQLRDAAQEGALYGSINPTLFNNIENRVRGASTSPVDLAISAPNPATVIISIDDTIVQTDNVPTGASVTACEGHSIKIDAYYDHIIFMPFISEVVGDSTITLHASVTDTILTPVC